MNKHLLHIIMNGVRTFILPVTLFVVSYFVVNYYHHQLWGAFVVELLLVNIIVHVLQWGNKEHLVRLFSKEPAQIHHHFYTSLLTRSLLLIPVVGVLFFLGGDTIKTTWIVLWIIGLFIYHSCESLIVYTKKFKLQVVTELMALGGIVVYLIMQKNLEVLDLIHVFVLATWFKTLVLVVQLFPKPIVLRINFKEFLISLPFFVFGFSGLLQSRIDQYIIALFCDQEVIGTYQIFLSAFILLQALSAIIITPFNKIIYRISLPVFNKIHRKITLLSILLVLLFGTVISAGLFYFYQLNVAYGYYLAGILFAFPPFVYVPIIYLFYRAGKEKEIMVVNYFGAAFNLGLTLFFVFYGHPFNAIIASAMAQWLMLIWYLYRKKTILHEVELSNL